MTAFTLGALHYPTEYRLSYKELFLYGQRVRKPHRGQKSFVCHSTPHFGSTSREVSYSVRGYHTISCCKCKSPICKNSLLFMKIKYICYVSTGKKP